MHLVHEMTYTETIAGPCGPTNGSPFGARVFTGEGRIAGDHRIEYAIDRLD